MVDQRDDHPFGCGAVVGMGDVHVLPGAILRADAVAADDEHVGMLAREPGRYCIGGRSHDHLDALLVHRGKHAVDMAEIEDPGLRLQRAPCRLRDADDADSSRLHHPRVLVDAVDRRVLVIISNAVKDGIRHLRLRRGWQRHDGQCECLHEPLHDPAIHLQILSLLYRFQAVRRWTIGILPDTTWLAAPRLFRFESERGKLPCQRKQRSTSKLAAFIRRLPCNAARSFRR
jgi:hypothetical protein